MNAIPAGLRSLIALALACALWPAAATAQQSPLVVDAKGDHAFRHVLGGKEFFGLTPVTGMNHLASLPAAETVVIVVGELDCLDQLAEACPGHSLKQFVDNGGAVLIASDRSDRGQLGHFGLQISGSAVSLPEKVWVL